MSSHTGSLDTLLVVLGIVALIIRQFFWRSADIARLLKTPLMILAAGALWMGWDALHGEPLTPRIFEVALAEVVLVLSTGAVMGMATQFKPDHGLLRYRLVPAGILLWLAFLAIRVGSFLYADRIGVHLLDTTGAILLSFGLNRLSNALVIKARYEQLRSTWARA